MQIARALAHELAVLSRAHDVPGDLADSVEAFADGAAAAVPSFLGLTLILQGPAVGGGASPAPVVLTVVEQDAGEPRAANDDTEIRASLLLPLDPARAPAPAGEGRPPLTGWGVQIVLYAATPGAFVDLSADLAWLSGTPIGDLVIDQHLGPAPVDGPAVATFSQASRVDQAVGALLARGLTPTEAGVELARLARDAGETPDRAAERLLRDL